MFKMLLSPCFTFYKTCSFLSFYFEAQNVLNEFKDIYNSSFMLRAFETKAYLVPNTRCFLIVYNTLSIRLL
ncbi:hypothetical protein HMPREF0971_03152 [Segatella oris F0302]|uniref:Uncharacterized protein n=1 Tax=Segatella oris F0302 TaxID=649760 RepID=D1QVW1_9BACT|nr:hypothetical protein HMPREF0971_03152 [Segatella oris F0302]